jgi:AsmA protein
MRILRIILLALGGLLVLVAVAIGIFVATFDANAYRPRIVQLVKERTGRDIRIGDIGLKIFPRLGVELKQVSLAPRKGTGESAGLDSAQVHVALLPLLARELVVDEVRVDGLRANLVRHEDGTTNFDDLIKPRGQPEQPAQPAAQGKPIRFDIQGIRVTNTRLRWKDEGNGNDVTVDLQELTTGHVVEKQPVSVRIVANVQGPQPKVALRARIDGTLEFDLQNQRYRFTGMNANLEGDALDFSGIRLVLKADVESSGQPARVLVAKLDLKGQAARGSDAFDLTLTAPALESAQQSLKVEGLTLNATGSVAGMRLRDSTLKIPALHANLAESRLLVDRLSLTAHGEKAGETLSLELSAPRLDVTPQQASGESAVLDAKLDGAQRKGTIALRLDGVEGTGKALRIAGVTLAVDLVQQHNAIKGELRTPLAANLEARSVELTRLDGLFTVSSPALPRKTTQVPISGSVSADGAKERVAADLALRFDQSSIKAQGGMTGFARPAYEFDVAIDKLDLDQYRSAQTPAGVQQKPAGGKEEPIDFGPLKTLNLKGALRLGQLQAANVKASNVRIDLRAKDGRLQVEPLTANLYQGALKGSLSVDANANRITAKQNLAGVSIGPLLRDAAHKDVLEGKGTVVLDLGMQGNTVSAWKQSLAGSAGLALRDGAVKGVDLASAVRGVKSLLGASDVEGSGGAKQQTDFSELTATFAIKNGVAHNEDLNLKSPFLRVTGSGDVNIPASSLEYVVKTAVVGTMAGQGGRDVGDLKGLTVPVRLSGPFDQLKYKVEFSQMVRGATKEELQAGREALKGAAREKLQELLGGKQQPAQPGQGGGEAAQQAAPKRPEDQLKDALKGLVR